MGSSVSKQITSSNVSRNLSKNLANEKPIKLNRSKINPLDNIHEKPRAILNNLSNSTTGTPNNINIHPPSNSKLSNNSGSSEAQDPKYLTKDGLDPDFQKHQLRHTQGDVEFGKKAMSLGTVKLYETKLKLDKNNLAITTLNTREKLYEIGEKMKTQATEKTLLDPRTITAILNEIEFNRKPDFKDTIIKNFGVHRSLVNNLFSGIIKVARTRESSAKTINDLEHQKSPRNRKPSNKLQEELDKLFQ